MPLSSVLSDVFSQLRSFVSVVDDDAYVKPVAALDGATLGQHLRHATEFYLCLLDALSSRTFVVNYETRSRDTLLETNRSAALAALTDVEARILAYSEDRSLELLIASEDLGSMSIPSSFYRECAYNIDHSIHHMALLRAGTKEICPNLRLPESFGVAKSTLAHRKQLSAY